MWPRTRSWRLGLYLPCQSLHRDPQGQGLVGLGCTCHVNHFTMTFKDKVMVAWVVLALSITSLWPSRSRSWRLGLYFHCQSLHHDPQGLGHRGLGCSLPVNQFTVTLKDKVMEVWVVLFLLFLKYLLRWRI